MINPEKHYTFEEYVEILRNRIWYILIPFLLIVTMTTAYAIFAPRLYKASTLVLVSPQRIPEAFVQATVTSKVEERLQSIAQEVLSRTRLERIISELNLYRKERDHLSREEVIALMQKHIKIELPTKNEETKGFFTISYIGHDRDTVTTVANRLASQFIEENLRLREQQAVGTTEFLATEVAASKVKLDQLETALTQYKRRYMGELPEQRESNIKILEQLQNQYQRVGENLRAAQDRKLFLQRQMNDIELFINSPGGIGYGREGRSSLGRSPYLQQEIVPFFAPPETAVEKRGYYEIQKESLTKTLEELRMKYTENHPDVIATQKKITDLETKKETKEEIEGKEERVAYDVKKDRRYRELQNQLALTDMEIARSAEDERNISSQINKYRIRIEQTPAREQDMASLLREHQSTKESYETLLKKSQDAQQAENLEKRQKGEQFRIIDPARPPEKPFSPNIPRILLSGLFAAICSGLALAFFREQTDRSFRDSGDVEVTLGLKVLATIPQIEEKAT